MNQTADPHLRVSRAVSLEWGLRTCIANMSARELVRGGEECSFLAGIGARPGQAVDL